MAAFALELLLFGAVITALPFLLPSTYGVSPVGIGLVITVAEVASAVVASQNGRAARHLRDYEIVAVGSRRSASASWGRGWRPRRRWSAPPGRS